MQLDRRETFRAIRDAVPITLGICVFGVVFGAVAAEKGFSLVETIFLTGIVYAGASQFTALQFWQEPLPYLTIILVVFAINFRHVLYSASISRKLTKFSRLQKFLAFFFLVDPQFAFCERREEMAKDVADDKGLTPSYYFAMAMVFYISWILATLLGYVFGNLIDDPKRYGLDFILPIYFLVLLIGFRTRSNWFYVVLASGIATIIAVLTIGSPWHISVGAVVGVITGAALGKKEEDM